MVRYDAVYMLAGTGNPARQLYDYAGLCIIPVEKFLQLYYSIIYSFSVLFLYLFYDVEQVKISVLTATKQHATYCLQESSFVFFFRSLESESASPVGT
jgi:hypothetical protein